MSEQFVLDFDNVGDLDIRDGVCAGLDEVYPPTGLEDEADFAQRKQRENECFQAASDEIESLCIQTDALYGLILTNAARTVEAFGGIEACRNLFGDYTADFMLDKIIDQSDESSNCL
jgi:hypothetical protein